MSIFRKIFGGPGRAINKAATAVGLGENNFIRQASASSTLARALDSGAPLSAKTILNPSGRGNIFDPVGAFQKKDQVDPEAEATAALDEAEKDQKATNDAATAAANAQLLARRRRRMGSALSTGASTGGGLYASPVAMPLTYGKSSLGGG